jgi:hypothetical protein
MNLFKNQKMSIVSNEFDILVKIAKKYGFNTGKTIEERIKRYQNEMEHLKIFLGNRTRINIIKLFRDIFSDNFLRQFNFFTIIILFVDLFIYLFILE